MRICVSRTMYMLFWYEFGFLFNKYFEKISDAIEGGVSLLLNLICAFSLNVFFGNHITIIYTMHCPMNPIVTMLKALLGILFWLRISKICSLVLGKNRIVLFVADHSFSYMMHQGLAGKIIIGIGSLIFGCTLDERFFTHIWYARHLGNDVSTLVFYPIAIIAFISIFLGVYEYLRRESSLNKISD